MHPLLGRRSRSAQTHTPFPAARLPIARMPIAAATVALLTIAGCGSESDDAGQSGEASGSAAALVSGSPQASGPPEASDAGGSSSAGASFTAPVSPQSLAAAVTIDNTWKTLEDLQRIADENDGNRAIGTSGYAASADYVEGRLQDAGFEVTRQEFTASSHQVSSYSVELDGERLKALVVTDSVADTALDGAPFVLGRTDAGCSAASYSGITKDAIAVVPRGECSFSTKAAAAAKAGAGAIIFTNNKEGGFRGSFDGPTEIPAFSVAESDYSRLAAKGADVSVQLTAATEETKTWNLLAETTTGDPDEVVMVGAHLDSVPDGPGINDNGTGTAAVLETALQLGPDPEVNHQVRFAFWGAEELGLLGSIHYVEDLPASELAKISAYLNFDMLGSSNGGFFAYDGDGSAGLPGGAGPAGRGGNPGSAAIEQIFIDYFDSWGIHNEPSAFDGRSDYGPFIENGVPAGGIDTGADGAKTDDQADEWGGTVGNIFDPNYHTENDDIAHVDRELFALTAPAVAWGTATLATAD